MPKLQKLTINAVKQQVTLIEGFEIAIKGSPRKLIEVCIRTSRQTDDEATVSDWIAQNFPNMGMNTVAVLLSSGKEAKRQTLKRVRSSYPDDFRKIVREQRAAEAKAEKAKSALLANRRKTREVQKKVFKTVQELNGARKDGEVEAGFEALDKALRTPSHYHKRVIELCTKALSNGPSDTQTLIEFLLAAWTHAEKERDRQALLTA